MASIKEIGDSVGMSHKPQPSPSSDPKSGMVQRVGDSLPLNRTPIQSPSSNPPSGKVQMVGDAVSLSRAPIKGLGSAAKIPMSERAVKQSDVAVVRKRK
jgi:hypothetical protein